MEVKEAVQAIEGKLTEHKSAILDATGKQIQETKEQFAASSKKMEDEIKGLVEDLTNKGKNIGEILEEVKQLKAGAGRFAGGEGAEQKSTQQIIAAGFEEMFNEIKSVSKGNPFVM